MTILHVLDNGDAKTKAEAEQKSFERLARLREQATAELTRLDRQDVSVRTALRRGLPHVEIIRGARLTGADLIVVGRHAAYRWTERLLGSTAERVIQAGDLPVLIVARSARRGYRRPVLAVELTDASIPLMTLGMSVLDVSVTDATLLHAFRGPVADRSAPVSGGSRGHRSPSLDSLAAQLQSLQQSARAHGVKWRAALVHGDASRAILDEAEKRRADVITIGTHGRVGIARALVGSVATSVVRGAHCDVLVGKPLRVAFDIT
jgi:nucleotide-binding universal stress UspA family protein